MSLPDNYDNWRLDNNEQSELETCTDCKKSCEPVELKDYCYLDDDGHELYINQICEECHTYYCEQYPKGLQNEYIKSCNDMLNK